VVVVADLEIEYDLMSFESSGENAVNFVSGVPSKDSAPREEGGDALCRVIVACAGRDQTVLG
jgi:hypothetical protein